MESPPRLLSIEDCSEILQNCLNRNNVKVASYAVKSLSDKIEGFLGEHFFITIEYEDGSEEGLKSQRYFMKVLNGSSKLIFEISECLNAYNKEKFLYTFLLKEYEKYNIDISFVPKGYFCKPHLLVLEDVSQRNFTGYSKRSQFLDIDHCKVGLKTLSRFHGSGIIYEAVMSTKQKAPYCMLDEFPEMLQDVLFTNDDNNLAYVWFKESLKAVFDLIPVIAETCNIDQIDFTDKLSQNIKHLQSSTDLSAFKRTILHGDVWFNNFMFKYQDDVLTDSILIDFQLLKYGPPSVDVLHFMYANTRRKLRDVHFDELIEYYINELNSYLGKHDAKLCLPKDQYFQLCKKLQFTLKLQCICDRSVTLLVDDEEPPQDDETLRIMLFERRSERIIECFKNNDFFRDVIAEDMVELYQMLTKL